jgi:uncharacterized protein YaiI (UPF0178 family)
MKRLTTLLGAFATETGEPLTVVFDGRPFDLSGESVDVAFAAGRGPNAADHDIAARVEQDADPESITVVTSDRELADRVRRAGAKVLGSGPFRSTLEGFAHPDR